MRYDGTQKQTLRFILVKRLERYELKRRLALFIAYLVVRLSLANELILYESAAQCATSSYHSPSVR
jgi:hypothetical protein